MTEVAKTCPRGQATATFVALAARRSAGSMSSFERRETSALRASRALARPGRSLRPI